MSDIHDAPHRIVKEVISSIITWLSENSNSVAVDVVGGTICAGLGKVLPFLKTEEFRSWLNERDGRVAGILKVVIGEKKVSDLTETDYIFLLSRILTSHLEKHHEEASKEFIKEMENLSNDIDSNFEKFSTEITAGLEGFKNLFFNDGNTPTVFQEYFERVLSHKADEITSEVKEIFEEHFQSVIQPILQRLEDAQKQHHELTEKRYRELIETHRITQRKQEELQSSYEEGRNERRIIIDLLGNLVRAANLKEKEEEDESP